MVVGSRFTKKEEKLLKYFRNRVFLLSGIDDVQLNRLYNKAYALIYPSYYEGFGIPILEAMASGCPVIASNNSSIPEVSRGSCFLFDNNDVESAANEIKRLQNNNYRANRIRIQQLASKYFSWEITYKKMIDFYKSVLNKKRG